MDLAGPVKTVVLDPVLGKNGRWVQLFFGISDMAVGVKTFKTNGIQFFGGLSEFTTLFRTYFSGWIGMFTGVRFGF